VLAILRTILCDIFGTIFLTLSACGGSGTHDTHETHRPESDALTVPGAIKAPPALNAALVRCDEIAEPPCVDSAAVLSDGLESGPQRLPLVGEGVPVLVPALSP
jgi:hypothetical protein